MNIIIVVAGLAVAVAYAFIAGYVGNRFYAGRFDRCRECANVLAGVPYSHCFDMHAITAASVGLGWPITLPVISGALISKRHETRASRDEAKHKRRLEELEAERKLAREQREKTLADIQFLVENGIQASVPGLYEEER